MTEDISILDEFKNGTYDASLIATYNAFLPFYEEVALRRLIAKGCLHNVVMMDARQCGVALLDEAARPRRAGRDYSLLPVRAGGAFHPKIILLAGRSRGTLLIGSHNLTTAGYSFNRELTTRFEYTVAKDRAKDWDTLATFQNAFRFLKDWAATQPEELQATLGVVERLAPWLREPLPAEAEGYFLGSKRDGRSLWESVRAKLPDKVRRVTVVGPFFDSELAFLRQLNHECAPEKLIVAFDPSRSAITRQACHLLPQARFVDASCLRDGQDYLHAKTILVESTSGEEVLIMGSANPSRAAWLADPAKRNAEAVVVQTGRRGRTPAAALGLTKLAAQPELSAAEWAQIKEPPRRDEAEGDKGPLSLIAFVTDDGFEIVGLRADEKAVIEVGLINSAGVTLLRRTEIAQQNGRAKVEVQDQEAKASAVILEIRLGPDVLAYAVVHHLEELLQRGATDTQRAFRRALATLNSDSPLLEGLLKIVNKVIFDDFSAADLTSAAAQPRQEANSTDSTEEHPTFAVSVAETKRAKRRKRFYAEGDLGLILNALIYSLGVGLRANPSPLLTEQSEAEESEVEGEEPAPQIGVDGQALAGLGRRKVKQLLRRMLRQLELADEGGADRLRPIQQLAAVLGVVAYLRDHAEKAPWVPRRESLLPRENLLEFFIDCGWYLYSAQSRLLPNAVAQLAQVDCQELSVARGLLFWLAWECDLDVRTLMDSADHEETYQRLRGLENLLSLAPDVFADDEAVAIAQRAVTRGDLLDQYQDWLTTHQAWARRISEISVDVGKATALARPPERGDIVHRTGGSERLLTVVLATESRKIKLGEKPETWYIADFVRVVDSLTLGASDSHRERWSIDKWARLLNY